MLDGIDAASDRTFTLSTQSASLKDAVTRFLGSDPTRSSPPLSKRNGPIRLNDVGDDRQSSAKDSTRPDAALEPLEVRSCLVVPVKTSSGSVLGGLIFGSPAVAAFTQQHERVAASTAAWASLALENARLYLARAGGRSIEGRVSGGAVARTADAAERDRRLLAPAARRHSLRAQKASRGLETLERNATSLTQIVEDVLDVSRIVVGQDSPRRSTGGTAARRCTTPMATVQPAAGRRRASAFRRSSIRMSVPVSGVIRTDSQQVVWNLLSNAVKFTPKKGRVQVRVERVNSHIDDRRQRHRCRDRSRLPALRVRSVPAGLTGR